MYVWVDLVHVVQELCELLFVATPDHETVVIVACVEQDVRLV